MLMCDSADCGGRLLSHASVEARNNVGSCEECRRRNASKRWSPHGPQEPDPEAGPESVCEPEEKGRFCYECRHFTYLSGNYCSNPTCERKGRSTRRLLAHPYDTGEEEMAVPSAVGPVREA